MELLRAPQERLKQVNNQKEVVRYAYSFHLYNCFGRKVHRFGVKMVPHDLYIVLTAVVDLSSKC